MNFLIMANGSYGELDWYRNQPAFDRIICVDGGGKWAVTLGIAPDWVVGDMDSIDPSDLRSLQESGVRTVQFEAEKDYTDTQLALRLAEKEGATSITLWGATGTRLDHTISNLFSAADLVKRGIRVRFDSPGESIDIIKETFVVDGRPGETVSLLVLGAKAIVTLRGFKYPLHHTELLSEWQWAVSNIIMEDDPTVLLEAGMLAVIHYRRLPE